MEIKRLDIKHDNSRDTHSVKAQINAEGRTFTINFYLTHEFFSENTEVPEEISVIEGVNNKIEPFTRWCIKNLYAKCGESIYKLEGQTLSFDSKTVISSLLDSCIKSC